MSPASLSCEYLRNPIGIDVAKPRLSWTTSSDRRGEVQTAYQVLVASSEELLKADRGDLWDSGKVESDQSAFVEYAGKPLASEARCFWKVRTWDREGRSSDWSECASWTMGLLKPSDWKGKWIADRAELEPEETAPLDVHRDADTPTRIMQHAPSPLLRREFTASKPIRRATAYICGLGFHELHINGDKVGDSVLEPAYTRYDKRDLYVTHDVTSLVHEGANAIGVMLGNGWYNCHSRDSWDFDRAPWRNTPRLLFQMKLEYADGSSEVIASDGEWKTTGGPVVYDGIRNGESYDARLEKQGWDAPGYSDADWKPAEVVDGPGGKLVAQKTAPAKVIETSKPVKITEPKPGVFVFDMGRNISGWCRLKVAGPVGTKVTIRYDERLHADSTLFQQNAEHIRTGEFQTDTYTLKGVGTETWEPRFVYHGFQYAQVEGFPGKPTLNSLDLRIVHASFDKIGDFECSNDLLNTIHKLTQRSYVSNFVQYPTDCPHREKNGWTGDAQLAAETGLYNFDAAANYTRWIDDFDDCQQESGCLPGIVPTGGWGYAWGNGPAWDSAYLLIPWYVYLYRGDSRLLKAHYDGFKRYVDYVGTRSPELIADFGGLGDWCPPEGGPDQHVTPSALTSTAYYYVDARLVSTIAGMLGKAEDERKYDELAQRIKKAFAGKFYDPEKGDYAGSEECGMATALYQGLVDDDQKEKVMAALVAEVAKRDGHVWAGILGTKYVLHALTDNGRVDLAYGMAAKKTWPSWGHWIEKGATSLWEDWNGGASLNHIMFGDIDAWFYEALAGINPDPAKPGFKHIIIRPNAVGDLKWAKAHTRTVYGMVSSSWKVDGGKFALDIEVPANTTATVYVPAKSAESVTKPEGATFARMDGDRAVFEVGSGRYEFVAK